MKRFLSFFLYTTVMIFILTTGFEYQEHIREQSAKNFEFMPSVIFSTIFPIVIGILFGIPVLIKRIKAEGIAGYDWVKLLGICIPALYIAFLPLLFVSGITLPFAYTLGTSAPMSTVFPAISGIVFGFVLLECIKSKRDLK